MVGKRLIARPGRLSGEMIVKTINQVCYLEREVDMPERPIKILVIEDSLQLRVFIRDYILEPGGFEMEN